MRAMPIATSALSTYEPLLGNLQEGAQLAGRDAASCRVLSSVAVTCTALLKLTVTTSSYSTAGWSVRASRADLYPNCYCCMTLPLH